MRFGWSVIAGGRGEEWDGLNGRRGNSVKEINSGETERNGERSKREEDEGKWEARGSRDSWN